MSYTVTDPQTEVLKIGRGLVFINSDGSGNPAYSRWDNASELTMFQLGLTEGDIAINFNSNVANLTLPEISGDAPYEGTSLGDNPSITFPLFLADPDLLPILSPRASAGGGFSRRLDVVEHTLVVIPEEVWEVISGTPPVATYDGTLTYTGTEWQLDGEALSSAKQSLLGMSFWGWRGYFERPNRSFRGGAGDDGKNIEEVTFQLMFHPDMPEGHKLFTQGDPNAVSGINTSGGS